MPNHEFSHTSSSLLVGRRAYSATVSERIMMEEARSHTALNRGNKQMGAPGPSLAGGPAELRVENITAEN